MGSEGAFEIDFPSFLKFMISFTKGSHNSNNKDKMGDGEDMDGESISDISGSDNDEDDEISEDEESRGNEKEREEGGGDDMGLRKSSGENGTSNPLIIFFFFSTHLW